MRKSWMVVATALLAAASWSFGGEKPDFSGEWVLSKEKSRLPADVTASLTSGVVTISHREPSFKFHRVFSVFGQDMTQDLDLLTNGVEDERVQGASKAFTSMHWEGDALVLVMRILAPRGDAVDTVRYELKEGGKVLEAAEEFRSPITNSANVWVFEKREPTPPATPTP